MGSMQKLLETLQVLREADITGLTVRSGIERELVSGMLETLVRLGKVELVTFQHSNSQSVCNIGCCSTDNKDLFETNLVSEPKNRSVQLYRLKTSRSSTNLTT